MNDLLPTKFSLKQGALLVALLLVAFFVVSFVREMTSNSLGLSGTLSAPMAPSFVMQRDQVESDGYAMGMSKGGVADIASMMNENSIAPYPTPQGDAPASVSKIVKNAELALLVEDIDTAAKLIDGVRAQNGGQIGNSSFGNYGSSRTGDITIWVPSENFDKALSAIKDGALRVNNERILVSDVSAQFVDLEARLKNMKATEAQYLEIMKRSGSIADILNVTNQLSQTRQTIEQLQGQLDHLSRQVALSSIHITLTEEVTPMLSKDEWRPLAVVKAASRETLRDLTQFVDMVLVFLVKLPLLLLQLAFWGVLAYVIWRLGSFAYARVTGVRLPETGEKL